MKQGVIMENTIAYASDWADEARQSGMDYKAVRTEVQRRAVEHHPIYLGMMPSIVYDSKNDRYTAQFGSTKVKITDDVAQFLLTHKVNSDGASPTVYGHMAKGIIDAVLLLFLNR